jgi:hypothetical protein
MAARALAKAASASGPGLAKSAMSKTFAVEPDSDCAQVGTPFMRGAAARSEANSIAFRRLRINMPSSVSPPSSAL